MRALWLAPPSPSDGSSREEDEDDDDVSEDDESSIGSLSISASHLKKFPNISLSYRRDPDAIMRILTQEDRQDDGESVGGENERKRRNDERRVQPIDGLTEPFWKIPGVWNGWFFQSEVASSKEEDSYPGEERKAVEWQLRGAYDDVAWAKKRAREAMAVSDTGRHRDMLRPSASPTDCAASSEDAVVVSSSLLPAAVSGGALLWRNRDDPYSDWELLVERVPSGAVDSYKIHKLVVGAGMGASRRLAEEFVVNPRQGAASLRLEGGSTGTRLVLKDDVAECVPMALDWMYHPSSESHQFDADQFVNLLLVAEELDIPTLRDHLTEQCQQTKVSVEDLTSIWSTWTQSKQEAERAMAEVSDRITSLITQKVVEVMQAGSNAEMDRLVDELAPVADQELILQVMTSDALVDPDSPASGVSRDVKAITGKRSWKNPVRLRFSESNLRLGRFVARFCRSQEGVAPKATLSRSFAKNRVPSGHGTESSSTYLVVADGTRHAESGSVAACGLLELLVQAWTVKHRSLHGDFANIPEQVKMLCERQRELLELSLKGASANAPLFSPSPPLLDWISRLRGSRESSDIAGRSSRNGKAETIRCSVPSEAVEIVVDTQRSESKKLPQAYAL